MENIWENVLPAKLYEITLNNYRVGASLYGFNPKTGSQKRYFSSQEVIDEYVGELWLNGFSDVTIEEVDNAD